MADGTAGFRQDSSGPALLRILLRVGSVSDTRLSRPTARLSRRFSYQTDCDLAVLQPRRRRNARGLGSSAFARRYSRNHCCFLFLRVLRCFSSPGWLHLVVPRLPRGGFPHSDTRGSTAICAAPSARRVPPFGHPRIYGHLRLPAAFRSLSRPSSPLRAKASPVRP